MAIGPDLFTSLSPPDVWIHLQSIDREDHDHRAVSVRVRAPGGSSIRATATVDRYSPEHTVMDAIRVLLQDLEVVQAPVTARMLSTMLEARLREHVSPF